MSEIIKDWVGEVVALILAFILSTAALFYGEVRACKAPAEPQRIGQSAR
jgi:hypothetical protein